ncbi:MAG: ribonuclease III [Candidatus Omnitrophica bacterium]|nr:ribonuclease III [Candidatus Omnitrophota bacterium]
MKFFQRGPRLPNDRARDLAAAQRMLQFRFRDLRLLHQALSHRSYVHGTKAGAESQDYETMEFVGDAVLGLVICDQIYHLYPTASVGELAKLRAQVVSRSTLARLANDMGLSRWLLLGPGERARQEGERTSVAAGAMEAVIAAMYFDRGLSPVTRWIQRVFLETIVAIEAGQVAADYKSMLQEYVLRYFHSVPDYRVVGESGPGHRRRFEVAVAWRGREYGFGVGLSKKAAEQSAARRALDHVLSGGHVPSAGPA